MSRRLQRAGLLSAALGAGAFGPASADADKRQATFAVTINALTRRHEVSAGAVDRIEFLAAANPKMHGVQYTRIPTFTFACPTPGGSQTVFLGSGSSGAVPTGCRQLSDTFSDPENATQVDLSVRVAHRAWGSGEIVYGVRYLNYVAHYDDFPGRLADRNVGFAPTIGYVFRL